MGLREDFRNAFASMAASFADAAQTMRHGETERGLVVQSSSRKYGDPVSDNAPEEAAQIVANAADFPTLEEGAAIELGASLRVVTSLKSDPVGATYTVGVSAAFDKTPATYKGTRRENARARSFAHPLDVLLLEGGTADGYADAIAPSYSTVYTVAIRREDWPEVSAPEVSDAIEVAPAGHPLALKVSTVAAHGGWFILKCRTRG